MSQVIDGGDLVLSNGPLKLDVIAGLTPNLYSDIDASRPNFESRTNRAFYGAMLSVEVEKHRPYVYGLVQEDYNKHGPYSLNIAGTAVPDARYDYNSWYLGAGSEGSIGDQLVYGVEVVYEGGSTLSDIGIDSTPAPLAQTSDKISAGALDVRLDYLFTDENRSRIGGEFIIATGDSDRTTNTTNTIGGNRANTNDHAFNAFGLVNTGLAFAPSVSNIMVLRLGASTYPAPGIRFFNRLQTGADLLIYNKFESAGPIGEATGSQGFLGVEPDLYVNWQLASDLTLAVRYGVFLPGNTIESSHAARHFLFTGLTLGF